MILIKTLVQIRNFLIYKFYDLQAKISSKPFPLDPEVNFVTSIASYPKRDPLLPAVFQALSKQTVKPKKMVLVLSVEDYPEQRLPRHLGKLEQRGVEIVWVKNNPYAVKKLIPVMEKYPELDLITLDDDIIYHKSLLQGLITKAKGKNKAVMGYVGKTLHRKNNDLHIYYREKKPCNLQTPAEQVYLIGWGGIYYPAHSLDNKVLDMDAVHEIVPGRGSDIWFWAAAHANNTSQLCLGIPSHYNLGIPIPQNTSTKPKDQPGHDVLTERFQKTIDYFGIREKLIRTLPNKKD
mgnify:CR=1 FL=1